MMKNTNHPLRRKSRTIDMKRELVFVGIILVTIALYTNMLSYNISEFRVLKDFVLNNKIDSGLYVIWLTSWFSIFSIIMSHRTTKHASITMGMSLITQIIIVFLLFDVNDYYNINIFESHIPVLLCILSSVTNIRTLSDVMYFFRDK